MESGPRPCIAGMVHAALAMAGPASTSCGAARPGWLAGQKLPPVAWLIADDHLALNGALDQLITGGGAGDPPRGRPDARIQSPARHITQAHNGVIGGAASHPIGRNVTHADSAICTECVAACWAGVYSP